MIYLFLLIRKEEKLERIDCRTCKMVLFFHTILGYLGSYYSSSLSTLFDSHDAFSKLGRELFPIQLPPYKNQTIGPNFSLIPTPTNPLIRARDAHEHVDALKDESCVRSGNVENALGAKYVDPVVPQ